MIRTETSFAFTVLATHAAIRRGAFHIWEVTVPLTIVERAVTVNEWLARAVRAEEIVRRRRLMGASGRPLNFTVGRQ